MYILWSMYRWLYQSLPADSRRLLFTSKSLLTTPVGFWLTDCRHSASMFTLWSKECSATVVTSSSLTEVESSGIFCNWRWQIAINATWRHLRFDARAKRRPSRQSNSSDIQNISNTSHPLFVMVATHSPILKGWIPEIEPSVPGVELTELPTQTFSRRLNDSWPIQKIAWICCPCVRTRRHRMNWM